MIWYIYIYVWYMLYDMIWYDIYMICDIWYMLYDMIWYDIYMICDIWYDICYMIWYGMIYMWYMIWYMWYDIWYDMMYDMIYYDMIYLLTAIVLTPGGSSTVHIYTQTIHRTTQSTTNLEECRPCPVFASYILAFALQLRKMHGKTSFRVAEECWLARWKQNI